MKTDVFERLDELSLESSHQLDEQIRRVQDESKKLRSELRSLQKAQRAEKKHRKHLLAQTAHTGREWGAEALRRGGRLTTSAGAQMHAGGRQARVRGGELTRGLSRFLSKGAADLKDDAASILREQGQYFGRNLADLSGVAGEQLRKQGQNLGQYLMSRKEEAAQGAHERKHRLTNHQEEPQRHAHKRDRQQERKAGTRSGEVMTYRLRGRPRTRGLAEQHGEQLHHRHPSWSGMGFLSGLLVAGGVTYWLLKRNFHLFEEDEEEHIELASRSTVDGVGNRPGSAFQYASSGRTGVVNRPGSTSAEAISKFVGVLSTRQYYPIERQAYANDLVFDANDLVFFENEDDAQAEGFTVGR